MHLHMLLYALSTGFIHDESFALKHFRYRLKKTFPERRLSLVLSAQQFETQGHQKTWEASTSDISLPFVPKVGPNGIFQRRFSIRIGL